jgi:hypothetical protein
MTILLFFATLLLGLLTAPLGPRALWLCSTPYCWLSRLQWFLENPIRFVFADHSLARWFPRLAWVAGSPIQLLWRAGIWILLNPIRVATSAWFNLILFPALSTRDGLADIWKPIAARSARGRRGTIQRTAALFQRTFLVFARSPKVLVQAVVMFLFEAAIPSLTLFHGTRLSSAGRPIASTGNWLVGHRTWAGEGIYLAPHFATALDYASRSPGSFGGVPCVVITRVSAGWLRPLSSLPAEVRSQAGYDGPAISRHICFPYAGLEYWRSDRLRWELCLPYPGSRGKFVSTWRVRPICVVTDQGPARVAGGVAFWPRCGMGFLFLFLALGLDVVVACLAVVGW